jgi:hypothetical protein
VFGDLPAPAEVGTVPTTPAVVMTAQTVRRTGGIGAAEIGSKDRTRSVGPSRRAAWHALHARAADVGIEVPTAIQLGSPTTRARTVCLRAAGILEPEGATAVAPPRSASAVAASVGTTEVVSEATTGRLVRSRHTASGTHDRNVHTPSVSTTEARRAVERGHALGGSECIAAGHCAEEEPERNASEDRDEYARPRWTWRARTN